MQLLYELLFISFPVMISQKFNFTRHISFDTNALESLGGFPKPWKLQHENSYSLSIFRDVFQTINVSKNSYV